MSIKQIRKILEKLDDALYDVESDLDYAMEERDDYAFRMDELTEQIEQMELELRLLFQIIFDAQIELPLANHFIDINPYVSKADPFRGSYEC
jgi:chromosome segregation ATPase